MFMVITLSPFEQFKVFSQDLFILTRSIPEEKFHFFFIEFEITLFKKNSFSALQNSVNTKFNEVRYVNLAFT